MLLVKSGQVCSQSLHSFYIRDSILVTIDQPIQFGKRITNIIFYALPNGNSTAQTMGKKTERGDDWHFDIQHIRAQTEFIRNKAPDENYVVIYLENKYKSWPAWKTKNPGYSLIIPRIIDSLTDLPGNCVARIKTNYA